MNTCIHPQKESVCSTLAVDAADFSDGTVAISVAVAVQLYFLFFVPLSPSAKVFVVYSVNVMEKMEWHCVVVISKCFPFFSFLHLAPFSFLFAK